MYVDEYALGMFKNYTSDIVDDKKISNTFFEKCEVEYILTGNAYETESLNIIKSKILTLRLILNVIHIYTDR